MSLSRRDVLRGMVSPSYWNERRAEQRLPEGQDILLDKEMCIAWGRGLCDRCERVCPEQAIIFVGMMNPRVHPGRCTLCGDCAPVCPTEAIVLRPQPSPNEQETP